MTENNSKVLAKADVDKLETSFWNGESDGKQLKEVSPQRYGQLIEHSAPFAMITALWETKFRDAFSKPINNLAVNQKIKNIFKDLAPKTPLENLLVERIIVCYLESNYIEMLIATTKDFRGREMLLKRQNSAHKRYITAVKALAQVRRLQLPMVQVNIGQNQVNAGIV